mmetsp:Transcript_7326/g.22515  ORF Transcript_7326/g.22515 Transcript_7326/m.22515 type:complete len:247 (+) Transcript_7326:155-895(+)
MRPEERVKRAISVLVLVLLLMLLHPPSKIVGRPRAKHVRVGLRTTHTTGESFATAVSLVPGLTPMRSPAQKHVALTWRIPHSAIPTLARRMWCIPVATMSTRTHVSSRAQIKTQWTRCSNSRTAKMIECEQTTLMRSSVVLLPMSTARTLAAMVRSNGFCIGLGVGLCRALITLATQKRSWRLVCPLCPLLLRLLCPLLLRLLPPPARALRSRPRKENTRLLRAAAARRPEDVRTAVSNLLRARQS